jgi:hypothetical protein
MDHEDDWPDEEIDYECERPAALGALSRGEVRVVCPEVIYNDLWHRLPHLLQELTLKEGEELVEFLISRAPLCEHPGCPELTVEQLLEDMAVEAFRRRAWRIARRFRDRMENPARFDEWCVLPQPKR